jgi:hypothetical protein
LQHVRNGALELRRPAPKFEHLTLIGTTVSAMADGGHDKTSARKCNGRVVVAYERSATTVRDDDKRKVTVPPPQDTPYPGTITLHVDASDTAQGIFRVHETIPVKAGALTLLYPQWIPGDHSPTGPIAMLAGLKLSANGKPLMWKRDEYNVYAFHLDVPADVSSDRCDFPVPVRARTDNGGFRDHRPHDGHGVEQGDAVSGRLFFARHHLRAQRDAGAWLAARHRAGDGLESGDTTTFKPVTFNNLVDSPIYAGQYFKRVDLNPGGEAPVHLDIVADAPKYLEMTPEQLKVHRALVTQATKLFGSHHYDHYDFLFSLSDQLGGNGTEHHQSSEDGLGADYFTGGRTVRPARPAGARVHAFVERQVPPSGRPVDAQLQRADGRFAAVGVRRADAVLGLRADRALRHVDAAGVPRCAGHDGGQLRAQPRRLPVAHARRHHQ